jgi:hypothetical protein
VATTYTGLTNAPAIGAGAIISRAYWAVPTHYTRGAEYSTELEAIEAGLAYQGQLVAQSAAQPGNGGISYIPETFSIDLRWDVAFPNRGGTLDTIARRTTYETLEDAREHIARLKRLPG